MSEYQYPSSWELVSLIDFTEVVLGQSPPSSTYNEEGVGLPFFQGKAEFRSLYPEVQKWCNEPSKIAEEGDVLISVRAPVGPTNIAPTRACIGRGLAAIRGMQNIPTFYLLYLLRKHEAELAGKGTGTTFDAITGDMLKNLKVPLPPLNEQHRIISKLEEQFTRLDAGINELKEAKKQIKRYRQSVLKHAFTGKLTEKWRNDNQDKLEPAVELLKKLKAERRKKWESDYIAKLSAQGKRPNDDNWKSKYVEPEGIAVSDVPELPEMWLWARAEQICDFITKGTTPEANKLFSGEGNVPFVKVYNLTHDGSFDFTINPTFISTETHKKELARSVLYPGDVLMNIVGPPLGKVSILPDTYPEWNMNQAVAVFRPMPSYYNKLLSYMLLTESILHWATKRAKATAGQFNLTLEICRDLPLPIIPVDEQHEIVNEIERHFSIADKSEEAINKSLKQSERLRQSILKKAFEGRLVPQDPNDEPASVLLKRIMEEKEKLKSAKRKATPKKGKIKK